MLATTIILEIMSQQVPGTHAPAAYSNVATNTTAIPCTIGGHTLAVLAHCVS